MSPDDLKIANPGRKLLYAGVAVVALSAAMMPAVPYMNAQADINIKTAEATAIQKWNGQVPYLPSTVVTVGNGWVDGVLSYLGLKGDKK